MMLSARARVPKRRRKDRSYFIPGFALLVIFIRVYIYIYIFGVLKGFGFCFSGDFIFWALLRYLLWMFFF